MKIRRFEWFVVSFLIFMVICAVDTVVYTIYSFNRGYYFVAPIEHIVAFHSEGFGFIDLDGAECSGDHCLVLHQKVK